MAKSGLDNGLVYSSIDLLGRWRLGVVPLNHLVAHPDLP